MLSRRLDAGIGRADYSIDLLSFDGQHSVPSARVADDDFEFRAEDCVRKGWKTVRRPGRSRHYYFLVHHVGEA